MGCDMVVALGQATVNGLCLFGLNRHGPRAPWPVLRRTIGAEYPPGARIKTSRLEVPQVRQTYTVLGSGLPGDWGLTHGVNEHKVAVGLASWTSKLVAPAPGLHGTDLVRLTLERSRSARHAQDLLTDLIARHGQGQGTVAEERDHIFLIADAQEALVIEAAGSYWAANDCQQVRAVTDTAMIRQDWQRVAHGLVDHALAAKWWSDDGSKIDFSGCLGAHPASQAPALKRWGRATLLLEQQNGHIDLWFLRRMLADHYEATVRRPVPGQTGVLPTLACSFLTALDPDPAAPVLAWCAFGTPRQAVYFPVFLDGALPAFFASENIVGDGFLRLPAGLDQVLHNREELDQWQARLDLQADEFGERARSLRKQRNLTQVERQATLFMAEMYASAELDRGSPTGARQAVQDLAYFAE